MYKIAIICNIFFLQFIMFSCVELLPIEAGKPETVQINSMSFTELVLQLNIPLNNPNNYAIKIKSIDLDIYLNNAYLGKITSIEKTKLPPKSNEVVTFKLQVDFSKLSTNAITLVSSLITTTKARFKMQGEIKASAFLVSKTIKYNSEETVNLIKKK